MRNGRTEMINWTTESKEEILLIQNIAKRAVKANPQLDLAKIAMDITATHCNGCKLKLQELLNADTFNFFHDVYGIMQNVSRRTGKLQNCFLPRYSA